jgi:hypothetical protein
VQFLARIGKVLYEVLEQVREWLIRMLQSPIVVRRGYFALILKKIISPYTTHLMKKVNIFQVCETNK